MTRSNDEFTPATVDEQIEHFLQLQESQQPAPSAALTQALKAVCEEDAASLERVRERYTTRLQTMSVSPVRPLTNVSLSFLQRKELTMHNVQEKKESVFIQHPAQRKTGWKQRLGMLAALLCLAVLLGSFITILTIAHTNRTISAGLQTTGTPTPQPTGSSALSVILKAVLTDSPTGNSEGVGPGLSGIVSKNHFTVGQRIWLFYIWSADKSGAVMVKWYVDGHLYSSSSQYMEYVAPYQGRGNAPTPGPQRTPTPGSTAPSVPISSDFSVTYNQPAMGKVELYWNGRLAATLSFVVKSKA